jgi:hypothetical protein
MRGFGMVPRGRTAQAAPLTLILLTVTMLSMTSIFVSNSLVLISKVRYDDSTLKMRVINTVHGCVEYLFASDPGTSLTIIVNMPSGDVTFTSDSVIFEGGTLPDIYDAHSIVRSVSCGQIVYDSSKICLTPASIHPELSRVTFSVGMFGKVKKISIEVERL